MIDLTTMEREPEIADEAQYERGMTLGLRLVVFWHVAGAAAAVVMMLLASRSGDEELPGAIGAFLRLFAIGSFVAHAAAAFGVAQRRRWGRTLSLVVNYLTFVVAVVAVIHQLGGFTAVGKLGTGLDKAFIPFLVIAVGLVWVLVASQIAAVSRLRPGPSTSAGPAG